MNEETNSVYMAVRGLFQDYNPKYDEVLHKVDILVRALLANYTQEERGEAIASIVNKYMSNIGVAAYEPISLKGDSYDKENWIENSEVEETPYFDRYIDYLVSLDYPKESINVIKTASKNILSLCANPNCIDKKKGLVFGEVQSGKTSNYTALINIACDYGYKMIILLAGMTDSLREQTQQRIDYGFIGAKSETISEKIEYVGVGKSSNEYFGIPITNLKEDFVKVVKENSNYSANDFKHPVILVVKKNKSVLDQVFKWVNPNKSNASLKSLLIIDDEADNASINTKNPEDNPSAINSVIRSIFNSFPSATYIGYTATPYANVFIDPDDNDIDNLDLFPSDFITLLKSPDDYFGADVAFSKVGNEYKHIRIIPSQEDKDIPIVHKKDFRLNLIPKSLKEAISVFLINNVIRTLRGNDKDHRTMLINTSTFNHVQENMKEKIQDHLRKLEIVLNQSDNLDTKLFVRNEDMKLIYDLYHSSTYDLVRQEHPWESIQSKLHSETKQVVIAVFNNRYKGVERFKYSDYKCGARLIAIGGYVLSRGLTLEGLMTSYFKRNGSSYDSMMQMCRWFGYRKRSNYLDLCHIYMTQDSVDTFGAVIDATNNLIEQFEDMERLGKKPKDYGLMVMEKPDILETKLLITARNKLNYTDVFEKRINYGGESVDTSKLFKDKLKNAENLRNFLEFVNGLKLEGLTIELINERPMIRNVPSLHIANFIRKLNIPLENRAFNVECLSEFIEKSKYYNTWDIAIATGSNNDNNVKWSIDNLQLPSTYRSYGTKDQDNIIRISKNNNRILDPNIFKSGLTKQQLENVKQLSQRKENKKGNNNLIASDFLAIERKPLFVIQPMQLKNTENAIDTSKYILDSEVILGFGLGFPKTDGKNKELVKYRVNKVKLDQITRGYDFDTEEDTSNED